MFDMDPLHEYTDHWLRNTALRIGKPFWFEISRDWILQAADARPGFLERLQFVARAFLDSQHEELVRRALVALAVVGDAHDVARLRSLAVTGSPAISCDAKTALFELERTAI